MVSPTRCIRLYVKSPGQNNFVALVTDHELRRIKSISDHFDRPVSTRSSSATLGL
ncbi:hypothetical protein PILCRDRAFT_724524 [Piloderma croceum F 1598]|uniref:Uncharacterized protein n=1 Tax=Piloderma croceum (strain F 1598) TaxID=765440 RepID=A0A0C3EM19_PILCF|nr:hypothetical protein PILCRDRAFT_724524 [Piloderma croceum F 1598]